MSKIEPGCLCNATKSHIIKGCCSRNARRKSLLEGVYTGLKHTEMAVLSGKTCRKHILLSGDSPGSGHPAQKAGGGRAPDFRVHENRLRHLFKSPTSLPLSLSLPNRQGSPHMRSGLPPCTKHSPEPPRCSVLFSLQKLPQKDPGRGALVPSESQHPLP